MMWHFFDMYLMCVAWDDNYFKITCGMLMMKEFQGKFLVMRWLVYALIHEMSRQRKIFWILIIVRTHIK